jgi:hypothetical protein
MTELRALPVYLNDLRVDRIERAIGEVAPEQQQGVAGHHGVIARAKADQPGHADVVRIVVLDELLAAQRVNHRCAKRIGERHHFVVCALRAAAAHDRDRIGVIQQRGEALEVRLGREDPRRRAFRPGRQFGGAFAQRHIARQHDNRHAALLDSGAHRARQHARKLRGGGHHFHVMAALLEQLLWVRFLKVAQTDFGRRNVRGDGKHRLVIAMTIEQTVDQMQVARTATAGAHRETSGRGRVRTGGKGGRFLVTGVHPADRAELIEAVGQSIQTIARYAPDPFDTRGGECGGEIGGNGSTGHA